MNYRPWFEGQALSQMAGLPDSGFIQFTVDDAKGLVHVYVLLWAG